MDMASNRDRLIKEGAVRLLGIIREDPTLTAIVGEVAHLKGIDWTEEDAYTEVRNDAILRILNEASMRQEDYLIGLEDWASR